MTNIEKVNKAFADADEQTKKEVFKLLGIKEDSKYIPKTNEKYWVVDMEGAVDCFYWNDDRLDNHQLLMNNVYRTEEEAEQASDFQTRKAKLIKEIEDSSDEIDWSDENKEKHCIWLDRFYNALRVSGKVYTQTQGTIFTTNKQFLEELIEERSDEVKELLFGIKL